MRGFVLILMALVAAVVLGFGLRTHSTNAATPGSTQKRLLDCPDTDGSGKIRTGDITKVVTQYGIDAPSASYRFIDDLTADGFIRTNDITYVVLRYGLDCPLVDTQVAQATLAILNDPDHVLLMACDATELASRGYLQGSTDVPGQGIHFVKINLWDGTFDPAQPEGLVCQDPDGGGPAPFKLAAELYVETGDVIGWNGWAGPGAISGINIDGAGYSCPTSPCSWDGPEGWHAHFDLCTIHIGTASAAAIPGVTTSAICLGMQNGCGPCGGTWTWKEQVGWMGHLWNFVPNQNLLPDVSGTQNGRFADCRPPFKYNDCPM